MQIWRHTQKLLSEEFLTESRDCLIVKISFEVACFILFKTAFNQNLIMLSKQHSSLGFKKVS